MTTLFPGSVDALPRPGPTDEMDEAGFEGDLVIDNISDAIEAIEAKLGTGGAAPGATAAVLRRTGTGASAWGQVAATDITSGAITNTHINTSAGIEASKLDAGGTANRILRTTSGSAAIWDQVQTSDLVANAITQSGISTNMSGSTMNTTYSDITGASVPITTTGGSLLVWCVQNLYLSATGGSRAYLALSLDGAAEVAEVVEEPSNTSYFVQSTMWRFTGVPANPHTVKARWKMSVGTTTGNNFGGFLLVIELKR